MKHLFASLFIFFSVQVLAQEKIIRLYDGPAPGSEHWKQTEKENNRNLWNTRIVYNVADPTLTVFRPANPNGTAVVICPGGGFQALSIDSEGFDVAKWLIQKGVTCFVLKYRLVESKTDDPTRELASRRENPKQREAETLPVIRLAMADGLKAVRYVRQHAAEYGLRSDRIGILGFSAGGTVAASVACNYAPESRPDFAAPIYLQYDWVVRNGVPADAPPLFLLAASDDQLGLGPHSVRLYNDWIAAKKPAELHMYAKGGHGFGMRTQHLPSDRWIERFADWLDMQGLLTK